MKLMGEIKTLRGIRCKKEFEEVEKEMKRVATLRTQENKDYSDKRNNEPCAVCNGKKFVQKFRNVVGEISGEMHGSFSLFGGSVSGSINGSTKTLPVLSCRECGNEREIKTWVFVGEKEVFWGFMHKFYFRDEYPGSVIDEFFLTRPLGTREYMLENKDYDFEFYNELPDKSPESWAKAGFQIDKVSRRHFIFFRKQVYPDWKDLYKVQ